MSFLTDDRNWFLKDRKKSRISSKRRKQITKTLSFPDSSTSWTQCTCVGTCGITVLQAERIACVADALNLLHRATDYSRLSLNGHLYKKDTTVKRTPWAGPCLCLFPSFDSIRRTPLSDGHLVPVPKVSVLEKVDCIFI